MPYYRVITPKNELDFDTRQEIATGFTDVHCGISAAPRNFVHVEFMETDKPGVIDDSHGAGQFSYDTKYYIAGGNRAGRPQEVKDQILNGLIEKFCEVTGISKNDVSGHISEAPAKWTMEGGHVLPDPGEEPPEWYAADAVAASGS
tara:strand:- start:2261 stop:2698 length:438 start_codon:yes stop_codon:yes gene_type:complete